MGKKKRVLGIVLFLVVSLSLVSAQQECNNADLNGDGRVDIFDLTLVAGKFGDVGVGLVGDINGDGRVDIFDLASVAAYFGDTCEVVGPVDNDGDGFMSDVDCNDNDAGINPGASDTCGDGIDQDCSGADLTCPPTGEPITLEAEDFSLDSQYQTESNSVYSNGVGIRLTSGSTVGIATTTFTGSSGIYDVDVYVVEEDDGNAVLDIDIGTGFTRTINYGLSPSGFQLATVTFNDVTINNGDVITLTGTKIGSTFSRADKVVVTETSCGAAGTKQPCGTSDIGVCELGERECGANGAWGACVGDVGPSTEVADGKDNDCDNLVDEGLCDACGIGALNICDDVECSDLSDPGSGVVCEFTPDPLIGGTCEEGTPQVPVNFKVAFIGDQNTFEPADQVLDLIVRQGADMVMHQGDFDYENNPDSWDQKINQHLGDDFPYFASVGNHDTNNFYGAGGYQEKMYNRLAKVPGASCTGDLGVKSSCYYQGLFFILSGVGLFGENHDQYIRDELTQDNSVWRICSWHLNQNAMQVGGKPDETGWGVYEECRIGGAMIATGHEHIYARTKTLTSMQTQTVDPLWDFRNIVVVEPGKTFAFVSGLGGASIRNQDRCLPTTYPYGCNGEWASIYTSDQGATHGALFITFNVDGDITKAKGQFVNIINDEIIDEFDLYNCGAGNSQCTAGSGESIDVLTPNEGATLDSGAVDVGFRTNNFVVGAEGEDHLRFYIDNDPMYYSFYDRADCHPDANCVQYEQFPGEHTHFVHWISSSSIRIVGLSPGQHSVKFVKTDGNGNEIVLTEKTVMFTVAQPPTGEFTLERVMGDLNFPLGLQFTSDGSAYYVERMTGRVMKIAAGFGSQQEIYQISNVRTGGERGTLGVALHPDFDNNGFIYAYYSTGDINRVIRITDVNGAGTDQTTIVDNIPSNSNHNGGVIDFGGDGKLYIVTGDAQDTSTSQDLNSLAGKILRVNDDGSIPSDNPHGNEVFSYGHRNQFGLAYHPHMDRMIASENGPSTDDEINIIQKGGNYGWPTVRGIANDARFIDPIVEINPTEAPTGVVVVPENSPFPEEYHDNVFFGRWNDGEVWKIQLTGANLDELGSFTMAAGGTFGGLTAAAANPVNGKIYFTDTNDILELKYVG